MTERVFLREVGLRDGLQSVRGELLTERKLAWIQQETSAGVTEIEVTSFVPARTFPIFADSAAVVAGAIAVEGLTASALTPNVKGALLAFDAGLRNVSYVISASEAHSRANVGRSTDDAIDEFARIIEARAARGLTREVSLSCGIATAFGCTIQGDVPEARVFEIAARTAALGVDEILIADTVGYANPSQVERIFAKLSETLPGMKLAAHFHDTRGLGLANVAAALRSGIRRFDASLGGLGGCPYAPGATGNVDFMDTAFLFESMGFATGIDIQKLLVLHEKVKSWLPEERFGGAIARAGLPKTYRPVPF